MAILINLALAIIGILCGFPLICPIVNILAAGVFVMIDRSELKAQAKHDAAMNEIYSR